MSTDHQDRERDDALLRRAAEAPLAGAMAMTLGHELAQPLSALSMRLDDALRLLKSGPEGLDAAVERLEKAADDVAYASGVVSRVRGLAQARNWSFAQVKLPEIVDGALDLIAPLMAQNGVRVVRNEAKPLPSVRGDGVMLRQIVVNLARNAVEAMAGSAERLLTIDLAPMTEGGRTGRKMVLLTIADTGAGMSAAAKERAGEAFFTTKTAGTGLGLSTCRTITALHKGRLWHTPREGGGTVFHLSLPQA